MQSGSPEIEDTRSGQFLGISGFAIIPVAIFASKGVAPLFAITAAALFWVQVRTTGFRGHLRPLPILLASFFLLSVFSAFWSISTEGTLRATTPLLFTFLGAVIVIRAAIRLKETGRTVFTRFLIIGGSLGIAFLGLELLTNAAISRVIFELKGFETKENASYLIMLNSSLAVAALFVWPFSLSMYRRYGKFSGAAAFLFCTLMIAQGGTEASVIAVLLGFVTAVAFAAAPRFMRFFFSAVLVVGVLGAPTIVGYLPDPLTESKKIPISSHSAAHRLLIWKNSVKHIKESPWIGHGFDSSRAFYSENDKVVTYFAQDDPKNSWTNWYSPIPLHPHNGILQIWLETGLLGAVILLSLLIYLVRRISSHRMSRLEVASSIGLFASGLFIFSVSFGVWQAWWQATLWLTTAFMIVGLQHKPTAGSPSDHPSE